jgi:transcriptional regulator with XRE-family HTH domain
MHASENGTINAILPAQVRAARGLLGWAQDQLAGASGVPKRTIARMELGEGAPQRRTLEAIRTALEAAGVEFIEQNGGGPGVRLKGPEPSRVER